MFSLESDKMTDFRQNENLTFTFLCDILKQHTKLNNFCKRSFFDLMFNLESDEMTGL